MLKLQYTETGLFMERIAGTLEDLIAQRVLLAVRSGQALHVEPGQASFLLPVAVEGLTQLELALQLERSGHISMTAVDAEFVEISVQGTWIAESVEAEEGTFLTAVTDRTEFFVYKLWQISQSQVSYLA